MKILKEEVYINLLKVNKEKFDRDKFNECIKSDEICEKILICILKNCFNSPFGLTELKIFPIFMIRCTIIKKI